MRTKWKLTNTCASIKYISQEKQGFTQQVSIFKNLMSVGMNVLKTAKKEPKSKSVHPFANVGNHFL